jgi:glycerol-3-phosphate O-acyltransferase 3/4
MCLDYLMSGVEAIVEDDVTHCFETEELESWNLLTRTSRCYELMSLKLMFIWIVAVVFRYMILLPSRIIIAAVGVS